jgi:hypothetical protein
MNMYSKNKNLPPTLRLLGISLVLGGVVHLQAYAGGPSSFSTLFPGDTLTIRLNSELNSGKNMAGTRFYGVVEQSVTHNNKTLVPKGAAVEGYIREATTSGRLAGKAEFHLHLDGLSIDGKRYSITTQPEVRSGVGHKKRNTAMIGGGTAAGLVIGAIAGGGKGAAIGAVTGAAAGTGGALATGKKEILIPAETVLTFRLRDQLVLD